MNLHNLSDHVSVINQYIQELRSVDIQSDRMRFRHNLRRVSEAMAYELSKHLQYKNITTDTPMGQSNDFIIADSLVLISILRAGLPMHDGFLHVFDKADSGFVSAYRSHHKDGTFEISMQYITCPDLNEKILILVDPMLATGASIEKTLDRLAEFGIYKSLHICSAIASTQGVQHVRRLFPQAHIWVGAIDEELTAKSYIVPGLGDAGDLAFGPKLQD